MGIINNKNQITTFKQKQTKSNEIHQQSIASSLHAPIDLFYSKSLCLRR